MDNMIPDKFIFEINTPTAKSWINRISTGQPVPDLAEVAGRPMFKKYRDFLLSHIEAGEPAVRLIVADFGDGKTTFGSFVKNLFEQASFPVSFYKCQNEHSFNSSEFLANLLLGLQCHSCSNLPAILRSIFNRQNAQLSLDSYSAATQN